MCNMSCPSDKEPEFGYIQIFCLICKFLTVIEFIPTEVYSNRKCVNCGRSGLDLRIERVPIEE